MNTSTITEAGAELIYRGLKLAEADIIKFRTSAEGRGYKHTVEECNEQLQILRGNGAAAGLFSQFAPQLDAFEAGSLAGDGSGEDGQLALGAEADDDDVITDDDVPVNTETEQGTFGDLKRDGPKRKLDLDAKRKQPLRGVRGKVTQKSKPGRPKGSKSNGKKK
jgi:hypothetical protein